MFLVWGRDRNLFYNDAFFSILKENKIFISLGESVNNTWGEEWSKILSDVEKVFTTGQPLQCQNQLFPINQKDKSSKLYNL